MHFFSNALIAICLSTTAYLGYIIIVGSEPEPLNTSVRVIDESKSIPQGNAEPITGSIAVPLVTYNNSPEKPMLNKRMYSEFIDYKIAPNGRYVFLIARPPGQQRVQLYIYDVAADERFIARPKVQDGTWLVEQSWLEFEWRDNSVLSLVYDNKDRNDWGQVIGEQRWVSIDPQAPWDLVAE